MIIALALIGLIPFALMSNAQRNGNESRKVAVLTVAGAEVWRCPIDVSMKPVEYSAEINGEIFTVIADSAGARVSRSDCPDQICVETGNISKVGQTVVCVPYRAVLRIEYAGDDTGMKDNEGAIDAVSG